MQIVEGVISMLKSLLPVLLPKLLDWPFLLFLGAVVFLRRFKKELGALFSRGDILISWGERSIRLRELSKSLDEELEPIKDDIEALKRQVDLSGGSPAAAAGSAPTPSSPGDRQNATARILEALKSSQFRWRSIERLSAVSALPEAQVLEILRADPAVKLTVGKSGRQIAGLKSRLG